MAEPRYTVKNAAGVPIAGADTLDDYLRASAAREDGQVIDSHTGEVVYDGGPSGIDPDDN